MNIIYFVKKIKIIRDTPMIPIMPDLLESSVPHIKRNF